MRNITSYCESVLKTDCIFPCRQPLAEQQRLHRHFKLTLIPVRSGIENCVPMLEVCIVRNISWTILRECFDDEFLLSIKHISLPLNLSTRGSGHTDAPC